MEYMVVDRLTQLFKLAFRPITEFLWNLLEKSDLTVRRSLS